MISDLLRLLLIWASVKDIQVCLYLISNMLSAEIRIPQVDSSQREANKAIIQALILGSVIGRPVLARQSFKICGSTAPRKKSLMAEKNGKLIIKKTP